MWANLKEFKFYLTEMFVFFEGWRKSGNPEETHADTGKTCKTLLRQ